MQRKGFSEEDILTLKQFVEHGVKADDILKSLNKSVNVEDALLRAYTFCLRGRLGLKSLIHLYFNLMILCIKPKS